MVALVRPVLWLSEPLRRAFARRPTATIVSSTDQFLNEMRDPTSVGFLDQQAVDQLARVDAARLPIRLIGVCDGPLQSAVGWLGHDWVNSVVSVPSLEHPIAGEHLGNVMRTMTEEATPRLLDWLGSNVTGRRVRLTHASKRVERLEKMTEFLEGQQVSSRTIEMLRDAAEELLTNAFYDAPVAAGASKPISRTQDVALPEESACDLAYGAREDLAIVRVRDPFGSLSRKRLVEVLERCARSDMQVQVDESMGGAGLGLWRLFSGATFVAISVVKNKHTEFLVGVAKRAPGPRPYAFHLFFRESRKRRWWRLADEEHDTSPSINHSVMLASTKPK